MSDHNSTHSTVDWGANDTPVSRAFDDPYYSVKDGLAESRHVFLKGNSIAERVTDGFTIAELGFGTGLNALATLQLWRETAPDKQLIFNSFEAYPLSFAENQRALANWPELEDDAGILIQGLRLGADVIEIGPMRLILHIGQAGELLPDWRESADAWYLDGFSPARNPEMWTESLMTEVGHHTRPGGTFATYTAAGHVRRALENAGFEVTRLPGFAGKRHMSVGVKP